MTFLVYTLFCSALFKFAVHAGFKQLIKDAHPFINTAIDTIGLGVQQGEKFMLIPSLGYESKDKPGKFEIIVHGWLYQPIASNLLQEAVKRSVELVLHAMDSTDPFSDEEKEERLGPFLVRDIQGHQVNIKLKPSLEKTVVTDTNGLLMKKISLESLDGMTVDGEILKYGVSDKDQKSPTYAGLIYLMKDKPNGGCSIISDIDDTIKISEVTDKKKLMVNTFKKDFTAVPGMAELYRTWQSSHECLVHYVSAMPSQLYHATQKFLDREQFPSGSFHMRHLKLVDADKVQLITKVMDFIQPQASKNHKLTMIENIVTGAPSNQRFFLVGDSGELDPEVYGSIARNHADRIKSIFIRQVEGGQNDEQRFLDAFKDVPKDQWSLFTDANELPKALFEESDSGQADDSADNDADSSVTIPVMSVSFPLRARWSIVFSILIALLSIDNY